MLTACDQPVLAARLVLRASMGGEKLAPSRSPSTATSSPACAGEPSPSARGRPTARVWISLASVRAVVGSVASALWLCAATVSELMAATRAEPTISVATRISMNEKPDEVRQEIALLPDLDPEPSCEADFRCNTGYRSK